jgi:hypothetical protein
VKSERYSVAEAITALVLIAATASYRFLALTGFPDDHYVSLAGAQQMLHGAWPSRDFVDLGAPLTYGISAAAQYAFGEGQLTEAVLMAACFGVAAALTLRAGVALTGSLTLALIAALIEVAIFPRTYSYPKMLIYAAAVLAIVGYARKPSLPRIVVLAAFAVLALLVRHDHGVYVGASFLIAVALSPLRVDRFRGLLSAAVYVGAVVLLSVPYLIYLQSSGGVIAHVQRGAAFSAFEAARQQLTLTGRPLHETWMLVMVWGAPVVALALVVARWVTRHGDAWATVRVLGPVIALALIADAGLIRDALETRLPDAIVAPALLLVWLVRQMWGLAPGLAPGSMVLRAAALVVVATTFYSVSVMGHTPEQLDRIGAFNGLDRLPSRFAERAREMRRPWVGRQSPSAAAQQMRPFFDYSERCVPKEARLLVPAFLPEVAVLARRPFAGGQVVFMLKALATPADHALVMRRLARERVPLAVIRRPTYDEIAMEFPELDAYIQGRFTPIAQWSLGGDDRIVLLADPTASVRQDAQTGWPCFR